MDAIWTATRKQKDEQRKEIVSAIFSDINYKTREQKQKVIDILSGSDMKLEDIKDFAEDLKSSAVMDANHRSIYK